MSRLTDLISQAKANDPSLGKELEREFKTLASRRSFGLNFERHKPESVELAGRPIRKGDKVRVLPPRDDLAKGDPRLWKVSRIERRKSNRLAHLRAFEGPKDETLVVDAADLIVVAEFRDYIYPGLVSTGKVERGGDKPFHTVINGENFHALEALTYTHRGRIDAIYIDPPYNTGAKDWKYNNDYVEGDDLYRHSKWLAFMERRLLVARQLLNLENSVLIVTIDEKEYLRLGLLLEQTFPEARITMVSSAINTGGVTRKGTFGRSAEYLYFVQFGESKPQALSLSEDWNPVKTKNKFILRWRLMRRDGTNAQREDGPNSFYPIFIRQKEGSAVFHSVGDSYYGNDLDEIDCPQGCVAIWPIRKNGSFGTWQNGPDKIRQLIDKGYAKIGPWRAEQTALYYLNQGERKKVEAGQFPILGRDVDGSIITDESTNEMTLIPSDVWRIASHDAGNGGSRLLSKIIPNRRFPFPKSLYAVEDALRFFVADKPSAIILDFFAGSGTTAHAVMRLNKQDGGRRQCISVTNNEVAADEQKALLNEGLRPGDPEWEKWGICDYITKPRIAAAITGKTPEGEAIKGDYKFTDEFPMAEGFEENAEFFTLTYETPVSVGHNRAFGRIAPLLWMRAGSEGRRIDSLPKEGWDVADTYGLLTDLDAADDMAAAIEGKGGAVRVAYIVTDDDRRFQSVAQGLPDRVEAVRLYESYLTNFRFSMGR
jgi:adenine-specific DNA-methyltransferase